MYTILIFEDNEDHARVLLDAIADRLERGETAKIVWWDDRLKEDDRPIYPIEAADGYQGYVCELVTGKRIEVRQLTDGDRGKCSWWQEEFDAAIIDIFIEGTREDRVGYRYAEWLRMADFRGPVTLITERKNAVNRFTEFGKVHKGDGDWAGKTADRMLRGIRRPKAREERRHRLHVNFRGRKPEYVRRYLEDETLAQAENWYSICFGNDKRTARQLREFFNLPRYNFNNAEVIAVSEFAKTLVKIDNRPRARPRVVWVDLGEDSVIDDGVIGPLVDQNPAFQPDNPALAANPIFVFLAEEEAVGTASIELLSRCNGFVARRSDIVNFPSVWIGTRVLELARAYADFREAARGRLDKRPWSDDLRQLAHAVVNLMPPVLLMAKATFRLVGGGEHPVSLAAWTGVEAERTLNSTFGPNMRKAVKELLGANEISELQQRLLTNE
jgi:hypothetical protein